MSSGARFVFSMRPEPPRLRKHTVFMPCERHVAMYAAVPRYRRAEVMAEGGWASSPCAKCQMKPGTDFFSAQFVRQNPVYYTRIK